MLRNSFASLLQSFFDQSAKHGGRTRRATGKRKPRNTATCNETWETPTFDLQLHPSCMNVEFKPAASGQLQHFKDKNLNKNTTESTATWENSFKAWRKWRNVPYALRDIPQEQLDTILQQFYTELQKVDGSKYKPASLCTMIAALDRHLRNTRATLI